MNVWKAISEVGVSHGEDQHQRRHIVLCNWISIILFSCSVLTMVAAISYFGLITAIWLSGISTLLLLSPLLLNHYGLTIVSRVWLIFMLTVPSLAISILDKLDHPNAIEEFEYFQFRVILITSAIYPFLLFSLKEKTATLLTLFLALANVILYDPIHELFGAGYYQMGFDAQSYYWVNYISGFAFAILAGSTYFLKYSFEKTNLANQELIERLTQQQKNLEQANELIKHQRESLTKENIELNKELLEKNNQLSVTNQELLRHNHELQQFSYTVSHNLRGPIASLKGIMSLVDKSQLGSNEELFRHLRQSTHALENTIVDLNHIIDTRNEVTRFRQQLLLSEEVRHVKTLLRREIDEHQVLIEQQFDPLFSIYSVKSMLSSILYNLISNAIKYRSPERQLRVVVRALTNDYDVKIDVEDNGLGMDIERHREKLFGLYKRFHSHTEGRGLGLFLVKLQVEMLGGSIDVKSLQGSGTIFSVRLPTPPDYDHQVLLDNDAALLFYDASINGLTVNWKRSVTKEEFEVFIGKALEFMRVYRTPNWLSNIAKATHRDEAELNELRKKHNDQLIESGLRRLAVVMPRSAYQPADYEARVQMIRQAYTIPFGFFDTIDEAKAWVRAANEKEIKASIAEG
ncbi:MAG: ATP-binding protein [Cyclobacteriaceae bacterium]